MKRKKETSGLWINFQGTDNITLPYRFKGLREMAWTADEKRMFSYMYALNSTCENSLHDAWSIHDTNTRHIQEKHVTIQDRLMMGYHHWLIYFHHNGLVIWSQIYFIWNSLFYLYVSNIALIFIAFPSHCHIYRVAQKKKRLTYFPIIRRFVIPKHASFVFQKVR